ncbi:MAG: tetratricopeptide repeat protein [Mucilaginibacter polytrichastri]|nr:tetratricopeptide repeat protein [Mucilaginibacter polytrichastri]
MKKFSFLLFFCIALAGAVFAQQNTATDSLERAYRTSRTDTAKAKALFALSDYWSYSDSAKAVGYALRALELNKQNAFYQGMGRFYLAGAYFDVDVEKSAAEYLKAVKFFEKIGTREAMIFCSRSWHNYGVLQQKKNNNKGFAAILLDKAIPYAIKGGDTARVALNYNDLGMIFMNQNDYSKARAYYNRSISTFEKAGNKTLDLVQTYQNAATNAVFSHDYDEAKRHLDKAQKILDRKDESDYNIDQYRVRGMYYAGVRAFEEARENYNKGLALAQKLDRKYAYQSIYYQLYELHLAQKNYKQARDILLRIVSLKEAMSLEKNRLQIFYNLAEVSEKSGDVADAYVWLKKYSRLADTVNSKKVTQDIADLETRYRTAEKEKRIISLQAQNERFELSARNNRLIAVFTAIAAVFLLTVAVMLYKLYGNSKKLAQQKELNHQKELESIAQRRQMDITNAMWQGEERERKRVARDLHDGLGGMLAGVKINLSGVATAQTTKGEDMNLYRIIAQLDDSVTELRRIARNMMPESLLNFGLETALKDLCESITGQMIRVKFQALDISTTIPQQIQIVIYRIVQELLGNAIKHAEASVILVQCSQNDSVFFITVEDDGKGFDPSVRKESAGIGLDNIRNRVEYLKGKMDIISAPNGQGTTVNIEVYVGE